jgi:hypothetical protein
VVAAITHPLIPFEAAPAYLDVRDLIPQTQAFYGYQSDRTTIAVPTVVKICSVCSEIKIGVCYGDVVYLPSRSTRFIYRPIGFHSFVPNVGSLGLLASMFVAAATCRWKCSVR